jgi:uncharacterized damage-inducible protein DinB
MTNKEFYISCRNRELAAFVRTFEALKEDKLDYKCHEKARTAKDIVGHIVGHEQDLIELFETDGTINHRMTIEFDSIKDVVEEFKKAHSELNKKLDEVSDEDWENKKGTFFVSGNNVWEDTYMNLCWSMLFDAIHHRGQLSTYIRPMGGRNPSIYGPTAEDMEEMSIH